MNTKVSLIITVLNEEKTIHSLLQALSQQTYPAAEVIITDGGSTDRTQLLITQFAQTHPSLNLKLLQKRGNRSSGRNAAIAEAENSLIAITDAGCIPHKDWLEQLIKVASEKAGQKQNTFVVAGYYDARPKTPFEAAVVPYVLVMPDKVNPDHFLPATRSMLMTRSVWEKLGGFNENLSDNEDYAFAKKMVTQKIPIYFTVHAKVTWMVRQNIRQFFWMIYRFARGDMTAKILRPKVAFLFFRYIFFVCFLAIAVLLHNLFSFAAWFSLILIYLVWSIKKNYRYAKEGWYWLPILQITADVVVILGSITGLF